MIERATRFGNLVFDRDAIVRAALRAYVEACLKRVAHLSFPACAVPGWTGDLQRGAFYNGNGCGSEDVVAWTEVGVVGLGYELGFGPLEHLRLPASAVTGGADDVRAALPGLPAALEPALTMAAGLLIVGPEGERLAGIGFWLHGDRIAGTLFDDPIGPGADRLAMWGLLKGGRLLPLLALSSDPHNKAALAEYARKYAPVHAVMDAIVDRRLGGPTELTAYELATLIPSPPEPERLLGAQRRLQEVGITWPGSPELPPEEPRPKGRNPFLPRS